MYLLIRSKLGRGIPGVDSVEYTGKVLYVYNILLEKHDQMMVHNNLIVETLHPDNTIAKLAVLTKNMSEEDNRRAQSKHSTNLFGVIIPFFATTNFSITSRNKKQSASEI